MRVDQLMYQLEHVNPSAQVRCTLIACSNVEVTAPAMIIVTEDGTVIVGPATHPNLVLRSAEPMEHVGGSNEDHPNQRG